MSRKPTVTLDDARASIQALRAEGRLIMRLPDGKIVGAALVKTHLGRGDYNTVLRHVTEILDDEAPASSDVLGEIVVEGLGDKLKPVFDALVKVVGQISQDVTRAGDDRIALIQAGAEARVRQAEVRLGQAQGQLALTEGEALKIEELEKALAKVTAERDRALNRVTALEAELAQAREQTSAAKQILIPVPGGDPAPIAEKEEVKETQPQGGGQAGAAVPGAGERVTDQPPTDKQRNAVYAIARSLQIQPPGNEVLASAAKTSAWIATHQNGGPRA